MKKKKDTNQHRLLSPEKYIQQKSRNLPIGKCFILENWEEQRFCQIIITRNHTSGNVSACFYLVDLSCLGVKNTMYKFNISFGEIEKYINLSEEKGFAFIEVPYELVHNIIYASLEFAEEYGFKPHKDFSITRHFLEEDTEDIPLMEIACGGDDGKPLYVNSGHDTPARAKQILAQLQKTAGEGNYHYIIPGEDYEEVFEDDEEDDDDIEDDEEDDDNDEEDKIIAKIQQLGKI